MSIKTFFTIAGVIGLIYGLFFLLIPEKAHEIYGISDMMTEHSIRFQRFFGGSIIASGLMALMARTAQPSIALRAILLFMVVFFLVNVLLIGQWLLNGGPNIGIVDMVVTGGLLVGSGLLFYSNKH